MKKDNDLHFRLNKELKEAIDKWCTSTGESRGTLIRMAIIKFLNENK